MMTAAVSASGLSRTAGDDSWPAVLRRHWPEYLIEGAGLGLFMVSACGFGTLLEFPGPPVRAGLGDPLARRVLMGLAMGLTAVALIYSPWGRRSGGQFNPAVTLTFLRLRRLAPVDASFYVMPWCSSWVRQSASG
jgi:aquaporin Z